MHMEIETDIKYCVTALIDLLGFSSHLEVGAYDLRTNIGKQAIERLQFLEDALSLLEKEKSRYPHYYPEKFHVRRINDAVFFTIDLDKFLMPSVGQAIRRGTTVDELEDFFSKEELKDEETFLKGYKARVSLCVEPLCKFIGLVSRVYNYINKRERSYYFPGAKAVLATGFRKPFYSKEKHEEDIFSANFSLSNVYIAEPKLRGPFFYLDNYLLQLLAGHPYARNVLKYSLFVSKETVYDPFEEYEDIFFLPSDYVISQPIEISLFRKPFVFRQVQAAPLSYLQMVPELMSYLTGEKEAQLDHTFNRIYRSIKNGPSQDYMKNRKRPSSWLGVVRNDIEDDINIIPEFISTGKSETLEKENELAIQRSIYLLFNQDKDENTAKRART